MRAFIEKSVLPLAVTILAVLLTGQLRVEPPYRYALMASAVLAAIFGGLYLQTYEGKALAKEPITTLTPTDDTRRRFTGIGVCCCILLAVLFGYKGTRPSRSTPPAPPTGSKAQPPVPPASTGSTADQLDSFIRKYVDTSAPPKAGQIRWAILISDGNQPSFPELNNAASAAIREADYSDDPIFRPSIIRDGKFDEIFDADPIFVRKLGEVCDGFIVARVQSNLIKDPTIDGMYTDELSLQVRVIPARSGAARQEFPVLEKGVGFTSTEAETNAQGRAADSLKRRLKDTLLNSMITR